MLEIPIVIKNLAGRRCRRCGGLNLLTKSKELVLPTTEELKRQELLEVLAKLVKAYAEVKRG